MEDYWDMMDRAEEGHYVDPAQFATLAEEQAELRDPAEVAQEQREALAEAQWDAARDDAVGDQ